MINLTWRQFTRPIRHRLGSVILYSCSILFGLLPLSMAQWIGIKIGLTLRLLLNKQRHLVKTQLQATQHALHIQNTTEIRAIERAHWSDLGRRLGEWLSGKTALQLFHMSDQCRERLKQIQQHSEEGIPQVILTAHFGHWELMAASLSAQGFKYTAIATTTPKGPLGRWLKNRRDRLGVATLHPQGGAKAAYQRLQRGEIIALLIDQSTKERSCWAQFLGQSAPMSLTADRLISRFNADVHWVTCHYNNLGNYLIDVVTIRTRLDEDFTQLSDKRLKYTILAHQLLEKEIIAYPEQWVWLHRRWLPRRDHS